MAALHSSKETSTFAAKATRGCMVATTSSNANGDRSVVVVVVLLRLAVVV